MNDNGLIEKYTEMYCRHQSFGNGFVDLDPLTKLNFFIVLALSSFVAQGYLFGIALCVFYCALAVYCRKFREFMKLFLRLALVIVGVIVIVRQITVRGETVLISIFGWRWTLEALENGLTVGFTLLAFSGAIVLFYTLTSMRDLMYSLERKGVSHSASYIMLSSFQTISDLNATAKTILESQKARGIETDGGIFTRMKAFLPVIGPLLLGALSSAEEKYIAMDARAFSIEREHTFLRELRPIPHWEKALVAAINICFLVGCAYKVYITFFLM